MFDFLKSCENCIRSDECGEGIKRTLFYGKNCASFIYDENKERREVAKQILILLGEGYDEIRKTEFKNLQWYKEFCREVGYRYDIKEDVTKNDKAGTI